MESPDDVVPSRRLPSGEHHAHPAQQVKKKIRQDSRDLVTHTIESGAALWRTGPDRGALLLRGSVGRRDEADERLAEGVWEALRDDVGAAGVDGGGGVAVLRPYRRPLKQNGLVIQSASGHGYRPQSRNPHKPLTPSV
jgi:hypothetical protein